MSSDNYILISRVNYEVFVGCASSNYLKKIGHGKGLNEAIDIAEKYGDTEYGISFVLKKIKQNLKGWMKKLITTIRNLIKAALDEVDQTQREGLFCRQFKGKGGEKKWTAVNQGN